MPSNPDRRSAPADPETGGRPRRRPQRSPRPDRGRRVSDVPAPEVGTEVELEVGPVAHGGHCVARLDGRVVFVRHTLPGERVRARVTEGGSSFWRADAVEVLQASPDRVEPAWPAAGADGVGGGELSHVSLPAQRRWKTDVLVEQLQRLARIDPEWLAREVTVEAAPGDDERRGLHYRTRIDLVADAAGHAGMRKHRSHDAVALKKMPLGTAEVAAFAVAEDVFTRTWAPGAQLTLVAPSEGEPVLLVDGEPWRRGKPDTRPNARRSVSEFVAGPWGAHRYRVAAGGFWQVHREAPSVLTRAVLEASGELAGATVLDLYSGAGLFTLPLADAVGPEGRVVAVEGDEQAAKDARRNAHASPQVTLEVGAVDQVLGSDAVPTADVVVLDPPRSGAGRAVVDAIAARAPRRIVYVACDPAALARDVGYLAAHGYTLSGVRGFDLFPHTHHVEAVAVLDRGTAGDRQEP
ncbi:class I SAM-dependent RNA methyltransferase [Promicromonospora iranensis]|uniref:tRNA/tmRNA/rRNA uracil-C5-methylase (TrmA/RlmC/RlmD family) n=1 Tax=Promicromonospora iranensis TaxID=1105144 RepID=A0ABU2CV15_9MICO|nr:TRAM domain-containing protein [Promicromonospora iranensis]MDR7385190.1 tRNA/tmRNA/rRNA uracil-C5-methylase (TrmA/RlmC/RlmD family) [Promicromonospora iranensis]